MNLETDPRDSQMRPLFKGLLLLMLVSGVSIAFVESIALFSATDPPLLSCQGNTSKTWCEIGIALLSLVPEQFRNLTMALGGCLASFVGFWMSWKIYKGPAKR